MIARLGLRLGALGYLGMLVLLPLGLVLYRTFQSGFGAVLQALITPEAIHACLLSVLIAAIAVPANTVFGVICSLVLVRHRFPGRALLGAFVDLPQGVSPVVAGLALVLVYGQFGLFGPWLTSHGIQIIFALPGIVLATVFVSLPFVAREIVPVLQEIGTEAEEAARTLGASGWQTFWRVTVPSIRAGIGYGVVLATARALGEFGAVSVVSGRLVGVTETLPLYVQDRFEAFDTSGAYTASVVLAALAILTLIAMNIVRKESVS
jgi:sulfate transport system permease protein